MVVIEMVSASKKKTDTKRTATYIVMGRWTDDPRKKSFLIGTAKSLKEAQDMAWDYEFDWAGTDSFDYIETWIEASYAPPYHTTVGKRAKRNGRR